MGVLGLILFYTGYVIIRTDNNNNLPPFRSVSVVDTFNLKDRVITISSDSTLLEKFPYADYVKFANYENIQILRRDISLLDSLFSKNTMFNRMVLSNTLTDSLLKLNYSKYDKYEPDNYISLFQWADKFKSYAEYDLENKNLYKSVHLYWMNFIANKLSDFSKADNKLKYDFKFRFLVAKCEENKYNVAPYVTPIEKVIFNILGCHWSHLFEASWLQASGLQKIIFGILILFTICSYIVLFRIIILTTLKKINNKI